MVVNAGLGMGLTAYQAEMHARKAPGIFSWQGEGGIFQIDEEEKIQGPLGLEQQLQYSMISFDPPKYRRFPKRPDSVWNPF